mgnify:FL=1|jgi:hypothetical protein
MVDPSRVKKLLESSKPPVVYNYPKPRPAQNIDKGYNFNPKTKNILDKFPEEKQKIKDQKLSQQSQREDKRRKALKTKTKSVDQVKLTKAQKEEKRRKAVKKYSGKNVAIPKVGGQFNKPFGGVARGKRRVRRRGMFDI